MVSLKMGSEEEEEEVAYPLEDFFFEWDFVILDAMDEFLKLWIWWSHNKKEFVRQREIKSVMSEKFGISLSNYGFSYFSI